MVEENQARVIVWWKYKLSIVS